MNFRLFYHSLVSDWNHGNAHFLRGVVAELLDRGHDVRVFEPRDGWSRSNLVREHGAAAVEEFGRAFPYLTSELYDPESFDIDAALEHADVVIAHEWTDNDVLSRLASHRTRQGKYGLLFHDTHHRAVSAPDALAAMPLESFDGVLAFGESLADQYRKSGWGRRVFVWHEAADSRITQERYPQIPQITRIPHSQRIPHTPELAHTATPDITEAGTWITRNAQNGQSDGDLIWIGNWGDDERGRELGEYLVEPVERLRISARVHGVRYPPEAVARLQQAGIDYAGWIPNYRAPDAFARFRATVHIPRAPYVAMLPGIPTIRVFEALACGIPLVSAPWDDCEQLFRPGDFVMAHSGEEMTAALARVLNDRDFAAELSARGRETVRARHTCAHRVDELLAIIDAMQFAPSHVRTLTKEM